MMMDAATLHNVRLVLIAVALTAVAASFVEAAILLGAKRAYDWRESAASFSGGAVVWGDARGAPQLKQPQLRLGVWAGLDQPHRRLAALLRAARLARLPAGRDRRGLHHQSALPVLDPRRVDPAARPAGRDPQYAVVAPRASRREPRVSRRQLWRRADD